jgi:plastocyanin
MPVWQSISAVHAAKHISEWLWGEFGICAPAAIPEMLIAFNLFAKSEGTNWTWGGDTSGLFQYGGSMRSTPLKTLTACVVATLALASASAWAVDHPVTVGGSGNNFSPADLSIAAGDTVTFSYAGGAAPHNVVSDPGAVTQFRCANGCDGAGGNGDATSAAWSSTITFPTAGTIGYFCEIHGGPGGSGMSGTITVTIPVELQSFDVD